ncbi:MAG: ribonuclease HII [Bacillota bacterium]
MTVKEIKNKIDKLKIKEINSLIFDLKSDSRVTVNRIGKKYENKIKKINKEKERIKKMRKFDNINTNGYNIVAGVDEVGRGPLAGPVVASAVILKRNQIFKKIDDSKKVSLENRKKLFKEIKEKAIDIGIGIVSCKKIDEINILNATKLAMKKAINDLDNTPEMLLLDAVKLKNISIDQKNIVKGDEKSISIAAASIIAKVTRDNIMYKYHKNNPQYGFKTNVGYGTKQHREAIKKYGPLDIHRKSFIKNIL